ncbi:MAG TPA: FG-GAP-like repeat-containing protein [Candidatus Limnocylindria bacterium]|nr:FG-GAP-like repeat-containing protein [Candidatus Limnocylindria bacterium]
MAQPSPPRGANPLLLILAGAAIIAAIAGSAWWSARQEAGDAGGDANAPYAQAMASGKTFYDKGEPAKAVGAFQTALAMNPANPDVHLNLANAFLLAGQPAQAVVHADEVLRFEPGNAAAHFLLGCASLRQNQFSNAVQELQQAKDADPSVNPVSFQLGRAFLGWGKLEDAAIQFREVTQFETNHPSAYYQLSQVLLRLGQRDEAQQALAEHQKIAAGKTQAADNPALYERCKYTEIIAPFPLEQPDHHGIALKFVDDSARVFGGEAAKLHGPFGLMEVNRRGWNDLLLADDSGIRLLWNSNGVFTARTAPVALTSAKGATQVLVGDLQNDRYEDAVIVGPAGVTVLRFATNGNFTDATIFSGLRAAQASGIAGALGDLDFTGKLGLLLTGADGRLRSFTNLGSGTFRERKGGAWGAEGITEITVDDWNNDDLPDLLLTRTNLPPLLLANVRGTGLMATNAPGEWPAARTLAVGDFNNDLRNDVALVTDRAIELFFGGLKEPLRLPAKGNQIRHLRAVDYDNDGWLDLVTWGGDGVRVWRNRGHAGFHEVTGELGLGTFATANVKHFAVADFDNDCDLDFIVDVEGAGLKFLRNEGGNANGLLKLRLLGNRSNASALGVKTELSGGGWHGLRTVQSLPVEIGVGKRKELDSLTIRWFDTRQDATEVPVTCDELTLFEMVLPTGSCPYLYAWNGQSNRFVTDVLGAAPLGLPVAPGHFIEADPDELVWLGNEANVVPRDGNYEVRITEELREVLYLDCARLVVKDHAIGTEVQPTSKLMPGKPFPKHDLVTLGTRIPLRSASAFNATLTPDGALSPSPFNGERAGVRGEAANGVAFTTTGETIDATAALTTVDGQMVSPAHLRGPQYRGLAEPHGVILDFGPLDQVSHPVLALTGWLRFGGGMANIAAAHNPDFPFPFPVLEAENEQGWHPVDVTVGAPAGKTKTVLVDLTGKLPPGTTHLRLTQAFEIHWNRIALFDRAVPSYTAALATSPLNEVRGGDSKDAYVLSPASTDLHWRGYSEFADLPWNQPLTPRYDLVKSKPDWTITPSGWVTRYGSVDKLLEARDNGLVLIAGGDELTLKFAADQLPPVPPGQVRDFFLQVTGWDKDSDYHVARGDEVGPLPWHGLDDQQYGTQPRPSFPSDALHEQYNTRWIGPKTFARRPGGPIR